MVYIGITTKEDGTLVKAEVIDGNKQIDISSIVMACPSPEVFTNEGMLRIKLEAVAITREFIKEAK